MDTHIDTITETLSVIRELKSGFDPEPSDSRDPLVFAGVIGSAVAAGVMISIFQ